MAESCPRVYRVSAKELSVKKASKQTGMYNSTMAHGNFEVQCPQKGNQFRYLGEPQETKGGSLRKH